MWSYKDKHTLMEYRCFLITSSLITASHKGQNLLLEYSQTVEALT